MEYSSSSYHKVIKKLAFEGQKFNKYNIFQMPNKTFALVQYKSQYH